MNLLEINEKNSEYFFEEKNRSVSEEHIDDKNDFITESRVGGLDSSSENQVINNPDLLRDKPGPTTKPNEVAGIPTGVGVPLSPAQI